MPPETGAQLRVEVLIEQKSRPGFPERLGLTTARYQYGQALSDM
jgi:hypothetical protein